MVSQSRYEVRHARQEVGVDAFEMPHKGGGSMSHCGVCCHAHGWFGRCRVVLGSTTFAELIELDDGTCNKINVVGRCRR